MIYLIALGIYAAVIYILFYVSRRSVGLPALAMTAGALMARLWTEDLTPVVADAGLVLTSPPLASIVAVALTFLPALIVMTRATKIHSHVERLYNSLIFALLGVTLTYDAFARAVVLDEGSRLFIEKIIPYSNIVITGCVALAIINIISHHAHAKKTGRPKKS